MGKRNRSKSKRASKAGASGLDAAKNAGALAAASSTAKSAPSNDIDEDCVMYESPDGGNAAPDKNMQSESDIESSADEMELVAKEGEEGEGDVEVTFDFYDPVEADKQPIAIFLSDLCASVRPKASEDKGALDHYALAQTICAQTRVGTVIKISDDAQAIGFITVLAVQEHRVLLAPLAECLRKTDAPASMLHSFVEPKEGEPVGSRVGLILSGRVVNLPPQLTPKMFEALLSEVEWATEDEPTPEQRKAFDLHWYLYITDVYPADTAGPMVKKKKPPKKKSRRKPAAETAPTTDKDQQIAFTRVEDEILLNAATYTVSWKIPGEEPGPEGLVRRKMGMFIKKAKMDEAFAAIKRLFGVEEQQPEADEALAEKKQ